MATIGDLHADGSEQPILLLSQYLNRISRHFNPKSSYARRSEFVNIRGLKFRVGCDTGGHERHCLRKTLA